MILSSELETGWTLHLWKDGLLWRHYVQKIETTPRLQIRVEGLLTSRGSLTYWGAGRRGARLLARVVERESRNSS